MPHSSTLRRRWSDHDRYFGPFTYARDKRYRPIAMVLSSGEDECPNASFRVSGFGHTLIVGIPAIIKPWRRWVDLSGYDWAKGDGYWDIHRNEYGFSISDGFLQVFLGPQTHDSETTRCWSKFIPWKQWRHVRRSLYDLSGEHVWTDIRGARFGEADYDRNRAAEESCPSLSFEFDDFDAERIVAKTRIDEREWRFGEGWFKWLSLFRRPKVIRSLDIRFSSETGRRKGSWKGGTIGHSIDMLPGELHEAAFRRYCAEHNMTFVGTEGRHHV